MGAAHSAERNTFAVQLSFANVADEETPLPSESSQAAAAGGEAASALVPSVTGSTEASLIREEHFPEGLRILLDAAPRSVQLGLQVVRHWSEQQIDQVRELRGDLRESRDAVTRLSGELGDARVRNARLEERVAGLTGQVGVRVLVVTIGTLIVGVAGAVTNQQFAVILAVLGLVLVVGVTLAPIARRSSKE